MKNKPLYLTIFPILSMAIAVSFPLQIHFIYNIPLNDPVKIFSMLTPLNLSSMIILAVAAFLGAFMNRLIYKIIPILLAVVFLNNAIVGLYGQDFTLIQVAASFLLFAISLRPFYQAEIKSVIMNPKLRWWKTPKRYQIEKSILLNSKNSKINTEALNFSSSGIYIKIEHAEQLKSLIVDELVELKLGAEKIPLKARVVRIVEDETQFPNGVGLEFIKDEVHKSQFMPWLRQQIQKRQEALSV